MIIKDLIRYPSLLRKFVLSHDSLEKAVLVLSVDRVKVKTIFPKCSVQVGTITSYVGLRLFRISLSSGI